MNSNDNTSSILISGHSLVLVKNTDVLFKIGDKPEKQEIEAGYAGGFSVETTFLPISITYEMTFSKPTRSFLFYPIDTALWNGWILAHETESMVDENNQTLPFGASTREGLFLLNATCSEPYFAKVDTRGQIKLLGVERTSMPVSSLIPATGSSAGSFDNSVSPTSGLPANMTRKGTFFITQTGAGIVPANNANANPSLKGAGNTQVAGMYHLTFDTFYNNTTVQLPKSSVTKSFQKESCTMKPLSSFDTGDLPQNIFSRIYVYDVWFEMPEQT